MEILESKTIVSPQVENSTKEKKRSSVSEKKSQQSSNEKTFDLAEYLRNSKGYVLGHAAFTK